MNAHLLVPHWAGACHRISVCSAMSLSQVLPASNSRAPDQLLDNEQNKEKEK